jgi:pimeloyl-ACP methyl ester carboxylesterase
MAERESPTPTYGTNVRTNKSQQWATRRILQLLWHGAPRLAERFVEKAFFSPRSSPPSAEERGWLDRGEPFDLRVHDKRIQGWRWGNGPGVLLVHGWNGRGIQLHRFIAPLIDSGYAAIAFDGPAHGASEGRSTSYFEFTDTVRALIEPDRGLDIRGIIAHSFGAAAVVNGLAHQDPDLKTVLLAPALRLKDMLTDAFDRHGIPPRIYENLIASYENRFGYSLQRDDPHLRLKDLRSSVLVIHDHDDPIIPHRDSRTVCHGFGHVTLHTTHGLGHKGILNDPAVVEATMAHLLNPELRTTHSDISNSRCPSAFSS